MPLVFGLGNPGPRYHDTRHNVGWRVVETLAARWPARLEWPGPVWRGWRAARGGRDVHLAVPLTFMNVSGQALAAWTARHELEPGGLLVVCDDVYLPLGMLRIRGDGSSGGHRGLDSIEVARGGRDWARLRLGVGAAPGAEALREHVLETFAAEEREMMETMIARGAEAVECWLDDGLAAAMNRYNRKVTKEAEQP